MREEVRGNGRKETRKDLNRLETILTPEKKNRLEQNEQIYLRKHGTTDSKFEKEDT